MEVINTSETKDISEKLKRPVIDNDYLTAAVNNILQRVKSSGDKAIIELTDRKSVV